MPRASARSSTSRIEKPAPGVLTGNPQEAARGITDRPAWMSDMSFPDASSPTPAAPSAEVLEHALFEAKRVLVGQDRMIERLFVSWLANGHCLIEGSPGLAKTLAAETIARIL